MWHAGFMYIKKLQTAATMTATGGGGDDDDVKFLQC